MAEQKQDDQLEHTYSSYVRIRDVALKTCQKRWMIGRSGVRGSGISVIAARHDDEDDDSDFIVGHFLTKFDYTSLNVYFNENVFLIEKLCFKFNYQPPDEAILN